MSPPATGRPLRALAGLSVLLAAGLVLHGPELTRDIAQAAERAEAFQRAEAVQRAEAIERAEASASSSLDLAELPGLPAPQLYPVAGRPQPLPPWHPARRAMGSVRPVHHRRRDHDERATAANATSGGVAVATAAATAPVALPAGRATPADGAFAAATDAYAALARGDRRAAAAGFAAALAADPDAPQAAAWRAAARSLARHWSGDAYVFARAAGSRSAATLPLLGGGQSSAAVAFTPAPLARRPFDLTARITAANDSRLPAAEAAIGMRWRPLPGIAVAAERLVALSRGGRNDWTVRAAGGATRRNGRFALTGYAETGLVGTHTPYAAAQALASYRIDLPHALELTAGVGSWGSIQHDRQTVDRLDAGPRLQLRRPAARMPVTLALDYRFRIAGNAAPGSGVALTIGTGF